MSGQHVILNWAQRTNKGKHHACPHSNSILVKKHFLGESGNEPRHSLLSCGALLLWGHFGLAFNLFKQYLSRIGRRQQLFQIITIMSQTRKHRKYKNKIQDSGSAVASYTSDRSVKGLTIWDHCCQAPVHDKIDLKENMQRKRKHKTVQATQQTNNKTQTQQQHSQIKNMCIGPLE